MKNIGFERERDLERKIYFSDHYFSECQLWSFCEQIRQIRDFRPESFVEIGPGNGFVSTFFRTMGVTVKTFDVNEALRPDVVAPVQDLARHVRPGEFDLISCCEVLEHIPFDEFRSIIDLFAGLAENLFLTLPVHGRRIGFGGHIRFPKVQTWIGKWIRVPIREHGLSSMHFWELDHSPETRRSAVADIVRGHYTTVETGFFTANPSHYYFACRGSRSLPKPL